MKGKVFLVGAGPGDPHLITVKSKKIIQTSDVIVYDSLINPDLLKLNQKDAKIIYVGKRRGKKKYDQEEINRILVNEAKKGKKVARIKGGDPFIFGRGGEEAQFLKQNNIEFVIVPGVSSVTAVPAYSGIPLTHRDYNSSFTVLTGHEDPSSNESRLDWESISGMETLVLLMSLHNTDKIMNKLLELGKPSETPVSITSWGTMMCQRTVTGNIANISRIIKENPQITTPAVTVVGKVVELRKELNWFEKRPLFGKRVMITRPSHQIDDIAVLLNEEGAETVIFPVIEISDPASWKGVDRVLKSMNIYDYVIFTSINGVKSFFRRLFIKGMDSRVFGGKKIIAIGSKTAKSLESYGLNADMIPEDYVAEGIVEMLKDQDLSGKKILIPRSPLARNILPDELSRFGAEVDVVHCYRTDVPSYPKSTVNEMRKRLESGEIDCVTFTSSSTVNNFFKLFKNIDFSNRKFRIACIGPVTSETVRSYNLTPEITAVEFTVDGLVKQIRESI